MLGRWAWARTTDPILTHTVGSAAWGLDTGTASRVPTQPKREATSSYV